MTFIDKAKQKAEDLKEKLPDSVKEKADTVKETVKDKLHRQ